MTAIEDRQTVAQNIHIAHADEAKLRSACEIAGVDLRTLQRWQAADCAPHTPSHAGSMPFRVELAPLAAEQK